MAKKGPVKVQALKRARDMVQPNLTVDALVLDDKKRLLLVERGRDPYKGKFALPGGFVEYGETVESAVVRELEEETGLKAKVLDIFGVYSDPNRDPRGHTVTIVYLMEYQGGEPKGNDDAAAARFFPIDRLPPLAFDHDRIVEDFRLWSANRPR
jgi:8-oxo-dGTP diphosphatase